MKKIIRIRGKGFSLVELMFGAFILLVITVVLLLTYVNCMSLNQTGRNIATAANDAQFVLEQLKLLDYDTRIATNFPSGYTIPAFTNLQDETVTFDPAPVIGAKISTVTVKVSWTERQRPRSFSIATYFSN